MRARRPANRVQTPASFARAASRWLRGAPLALLLTTALAPGAAGGSEGPAARKPLLDMSLPELMQLEIGTVAAASFHEQSLAEAPASVTIVTGEQIRIHGHQSLADILQDVLGFYVTYDRAFNYIGVRGFNRPGDVSSKVLLLVDGHRMNDNIFDNALCGTDLPVDLERVARVEVIRGPGSALYGTSAFFAVINLVTRPPEEEPGLRAASWAGSLGSRKGFASLHASPGGSLHLSVAGSGSRSEGRRRLYFEEFDSRETNSGIARDLDGETTARWAASASWRGYRLRWAHGTKEKTVPTGAWGTVFNDSRYVSRTERGFFDLSRSWAAPAGVEVFTRLAYDHGEGRTAYPFDYGTKEDPWIVLFRDAGIGRWVTGEVRAFVPVRTRHRTILGVEHRSNLTQKLRTFDEDPYYVYYSRDGRSRVWGAYVQQESRLLSSLLLTAGLRRDLHSTHGGTTSPRLALLWSAPRSTVVKLLYGRAFRAPNVYELYYEGGGSVPNPDLHPEEVSNLELVVEGRLSPPLGFSVSAFAEQLRGLIEAEWRSDDSLSLFVNTGRERARGIEAELSGRWPRGFGGRIGYAAVLAEDAETGQELTNSPAHMVRGSLEAPLLPQKLFLGAAVSYLSPRWTLARRRTEAVLTWDLSLAGADFFHGLAASAGVRNLLDRRYSDPGSVEHRMDRIEQDGRRFWLSAGYGLE